MKDIIQVEREIRALIAESSSFIVRSACQKIFRQRVNDARDGRKKVKWSVVKRLYRKQRGVCGICESETRPMVLLQGAPTVDSAVGDHIDPNRQDFNSEDNIQAAHKDCNLRKSSKSMYQMSKETGRTMEDML